MSVVRDAEIAKKAGGVTAMHDATEGGVIGGLFEIADASGVGMRIDEARFVYPPEVRMVCEAFGIDPVAAIAEGSLLITAEPASSPAIIHALRQCRYCRIDHRHGDGFAPSPGTGTERRIQNPARRTGAGSFLAGLL